MKRAGILLFGLASAAAGVLDVMWGELEPAHQPLQAWGDHIPGMSMYGYLAGVWLVVAGIALVWPSLTRPAAGALAVLYGIFCLFPLPRFVSAPEYLGYRASVYVGVAGNVCEQVILFVAAAVLCASLAGPLSPAAARLARWSFGLCPIFFGLGNLTALDTVTPMIPKWMPLPAMFWAIVTGVGFVLAGLGILSGVLDVLAARLLGLMLLAFSALSLTPITLAHPHDHTAWGGNAFNLTVVGAAWIMAGWFAALRERAPVSQRTEWAPASGD